MSDERIRNAWLAEFGDDSHISLHCYILAYMEGRKEVADEITRLQVENANLQETVRKLQQKFPVAISRARQAGYTSANLHWEEGHNFGKEQQRLRQEDNATFTAGIMKLEDQLRTAEQRVAREWISSKEPPAHGNEVLIYRVNNRGFEIENVDVGYYNQVLERWQPRGCNGNWNDEVLYWMEKPKPPKYGL